MESDLLHSERSRAPCVRRSSLLLRAIRVPGPGRGPPAARLEGLGPWGQGRALWGGWGPGAGPLGWTTQSSKAAEAGFPLKVMMLPFAKAGS